MSRITTIGLLLLLFLGCTDELCKRRMGCAMGMFAEKSHRDYLVGMKALKKRVELKLLQDGLRRL